jgi:hypothetical protein
MPSESLYICSIIDVDDVDVIFTKWELALSLDEELDVDPICSLPDF